MMPRKFHVSFVSVPHVRIQGAPDIHVNQGSAINLTCIISYSPEPPAFVFWYRGNKESTVDIGYSVTGYSVISAIVSVLRWDRFLYTNNYWI